MKQQLAILVCLLANACGEVRADIFRNVNLSEEELRFTSAAMSSLCEQSLGECCTSIGDGDSTIQMSDSLKLSDSLSTDSFDPDSGASRIYILANAWQDNQEYWTTFPHLVTYELYFTSNVQHELIHHCAISKHKKMGHLPDGNLMSACVETRPQDGKLTAADLAYLRGN